MSLRKRRVGVVLAVAVVLGGAGIWAGFSSRGQLAAGPLGPTDGGSSMSDPGPQVLPDHPFTYLGAEFDSHIGAILDGVELRSATPGLRIVGEYVVLRSESVPVLIGREFPPPGVVLHPLEGWRVDGVTAVTLALQADRPGSYRASGITLDYHVGSTQYRAFWPTGVKVTVRGP